MAVSSVRLAAFLDPDYPGRLTADERKSLEVCAEAHLPGRIAPLYRLSYESAEAWCKRVEFELVHGRK